MSIKTYFQTPQQEFNEAQITFERNQKHWDEIQSTFPDSINGCELCMSQIGKNLIRAFIYCPENISEEDSRVAMKWMKAYSPQIKRDLRQDAGTFYWRTDTIKLKDAYGEYEYIIFLERTHPLNCEIKKVTKTVEVFESVCV